MGYSVADNLLDFLFIEALSDCSLLIPTCFQVFTSPPKRCVHRCWALQWSIAICISWMCIIHASTNLPWHSNVNNSTSSNLLHKIQNQLCPDPSVSISTVHTSSQCPENPNFSLHSYPHTNGQSPYLRHWFMKFVQPPESGRLVQTDHWENCNLIKFCQGSNFNARKSWFP